MFEDLPTPPAPPLCVGESVPAPPPSPAPPPPPAVALPEPPKLPEPPLFLNPVIPSDRVPTLSAVLLKPPPP